MDQILSSLNDGIDGIDGSGTLPAQLCEACVQALPVQGAGLALMTTTGHGGALAVTDEPARLMEDLQLSLGEGPCVDASLNGRPVLEPDLARNARTRWHEFGPAVLEAGIAAIFAFPLQIGGIRLGALDLYRSTAGGLDDEDLSDALAFADAALVLLLHLQNQAEPGGGLHPHMSDTIEDRPQIHQATGMVSVQAKVGLTEAILLLRAHAYAAERPIVDVARDVVARHYRFTPKDDHHE